jgi:ketosteroid isomerase-like protein
LSNLVEGITLRKMLAVWAAAAAFSATLAAADSETDIARRLLGLERQAMDGWAKGNPDPDLARSDATVVYIHPAADGRLEGLPALTELFERYRGRALFDSYEIIDPKVQVSGDVAVLTFTFECRNGTTTSRYYASEVYQHKDPAWRLIHAHWSKAKTQ